ncbi:efflux RND transporter permease subunit [Leptolyngbya sp. AN02str]|jgi:HAE1 family hydrophobic/amphiphilic exporter-1|uniref:Efflux RND transporter permease subunit n=1 Tax=Leptolyngbya sp. NK1-12 TaxID=2547451 RepID=A0AA97APQ4_9CYAN|nr:efflux RND transporter permease subunit [Leptolyngbya sp. NK1-12]WNZ28112.1 efflux RND transporter permease subunit [Leptolyngbya sp. NK1-12]
MKTFLTRWSIKHPVVVAALYIAVVVLSMLTLVLLPVRMMPYVESPLVSIVTMAPGSSPTEVETYITKPIEQRLTVLDGVRFIRSSSQQDMSLVTIQFAWGDDIGKAVQSVQSVMTAAEGDIELDGFNSRSYWVLPIDPLNRPVLTLALRGEGWDPVQLREFADNTLVDRLTQVPDVQAVSIFGGYRRQLQVVVDRQKLAAYGLSILQVRDAIDANNVSQGAGVLTQGDSEILVRSDKRALSAADVMDYPVLEQDGQVVYVRDVAIVKDTAEERRSSYRYNGEAALAVNVIQQPNSSSPQVIRQVRAELKRIQAANPGLTFEEAYDNSYLVNIILNSTFQELLISVLLAGLVILVFLEDFRATAIIMISIPLSLALSTLPFIPIQMSLNSSTLIGMMMALGKLVDDSIIVIDAIDQKLRGGLRPLQAAIQGTGEVFLASAAASCVMIAALIPTILAGGLTGLMFVGIVWPMVFAFVASLLVSVTLIPLIAAFVLKPPQSQPRRNGLQRLLLPVQVGFQRLEQGYGWLLDRCLNNREMTLAIAAVSIVLAVALYPFVPQEMMPLGDSGQFMASLEMEAGTSFAKTDESTARFEQILLAQPDVEKVSSQVGFEFTRNSTYFSGYSMDSVNAASLTVTLKDNRDRDIWEIMDSVAAEAHRTIPGLRRIALKEMGVDLMSTSAAPIQLAVYGEELDTLHRLAADVLRIAEATPSLVMAQTSSSLTQPEYQLTVDRRRAEELGMNVQMVAEQARYALSGGFTRRYYNRPNLRQNSILVRYDAADRATPDDLAATYITTPQGQQVPLSTVATLERRNGPTLIEHVNGKRVVYVNGYYRKGAPASMDLSMAVAMRAGTDLNFPPGYGLDSMGDMTDMMIEFSRLLKGLLVSLILIYLILVIQFGSFIQPLIMMGAIPLQLVGVFGGLILAQQTLSTVSILGIVILSGLSLSAAILLLELVLAKRAEGVPRDIAIRMAGPVRLKAITMTTLTTMIVIVRLAFFPDIGMDAYSPIATVILGGLTISTLLTLIVIPVMYSVVDDTIQWFVHLETKIKRHNHWTRG